VCIFVCTNNTKAIGGNTFLYILHQLNYKERNDYLNMKIKIFLFLLSMIFIVSCVSKITLDGRPIPEHAYVQVNTQTGIKIDCLFLRYIERNEENEKFSWPDYLEFNKDINIPLETTGMYIIIQISNPKEIPYSLIKRYTLWNNNDLYPQEVMQIVSISKYPNRIHNIKLPFENGIKVDLELEFLDEQGELIMGIGQAQYQVNYREGGEKKKAVRE